MASIQGQILVVTVVGCHDLKDTEWITRQDPYVCLQYGDTRFRTNTCKDGSRNPRFNEKFTFKLVDGIREIEVNVWNSNLIRKDYHIGGGSIQLERVLDSGYDDSPCSLYTKTGRTAGDLRVIMFYENAQLRPCSPISPVNPQPYQPHPSPTYLYPPPPPGHPSPQQQHLHYPPGF